MRAALLLAEQGAARGEVPVGAVVLRAGRSIGSAHNETVARRDPTAHAELLALRQALESAGTDRLPDATLYVTLEPCAQCAGAAILAKVGRVVFGANDDRVGMAGSVYDLLRDPRQNWRPEVLSGILDAECGELLKRFFQDRRLGMEG